MYHLRQPHSYFEAKYGWTPIEITRRRIALDSIFSWNYGLNKDRDFAMLPTEYKTGGNIVSGRNVLHFRLFEGFSMLSDDGVRRSERGR